MTFHLDSYADLVQHLHNLKEAVLMCVVHNTVGSDWTEAGTCEYGLRSDCLLTVVLTCSSNQQRIQPATYSCQ